MAGDHMMLCNAFELSGLRFGDLWIRYFGLGGTGTPTDLHTYLDGDHQIPNGQYDVIAHAINERFTKLDMNHPVPYLHPEP